MPIACRAAPAAISCRPPTRSASSPATTADTAGDAVHGSARTPAPSGL